MYQSALGVVLHFSRVAGVAPFQGGDEYSVSSFLAICAKLFITITVVSFILFDTTTTLLFQTYESVLAFDLLTWTSKIFAIIAAYVSIFTSSKRTLRLIRLPKELDKIDNQIMGDFSQNINERKLILLIFIYLHVSLAIRCYDFLFNDQSVRKIGYTYLCVMVLIAYYMVNLSELQLVLFAKRYAFSLQLINDSLKKLYNSQSIKDISQLHIIKNVPIPAWDYDNEVQSVYRRFVKEEPSKPELLLIIVLSCLNTLDKIKVENIQEPNFVRQCIGNYIHVCNIISTSTEGDSLLIAILIMYYILHVLSPTYILILYFVTPDPENFEPDLYLTIYWLVVYTVILVVFVEPIHKTELEIQRLELLLTSLMLKNLDDEDINNELLLFWRVMSLNQPTHSPLGMFNLNRSLIMQTFGTLVTYLVIIVTYGPEMKKHLESN